jgi:hypothetical protein
MSPPPEYVFVLAKKEERLLYYDDVEEDFGVAIPDEDGVLRNWGKVAFPDYRFEFACRIHHPTGEFTYTATNIFLRLKCFVICAATRRN